MSESAIEIAEVTSVTHEIRDAFTALLPQLSASAQEISDEHLGEIVSSEVTRLLIARVDGAIAGMLTVVVFRVPTGLRAWIEDVVVDASARGKGVGEALTREAIRIAQQAGVKSLDLTSRRSRVAAHRLYEKCGFQVRETTVYRYAGE